MQKESSRSDMRKYFILWGHYFAFRKGAKIGIFWTLLSQVQLKTIQNYYFLDQKCRIKMYTLSYFWCKLVALEPKNLKFQIWAKTNTTALLGCVGAVVKHRV